MTQDELLALIDRAAAESWTELDLSGQNLSELPAALGNLLNLSGLYLGSNQITEIPEAIVILRWRGHNIMELGMPRN